MKSIVIITWSLFMLSQVALSQTSQKTNAFGKYVFYLHGRIVQEEGPPAISPEYGEYEYLNIVDTLRSYGYNVISERRAKGTQILTYAGKVVRQIDSLMKRGVPPERIIVVGASMGSGIALTVAQQVYNPRINYAILAACDENMISYQRENNLELCGNFLSIYERSDEARSCDRLFNGQVCKPGYQEVALNMNNRHGFIYKPYKEWMQPLVAWINALK